MATTEPWMVAFVDPNTLVCFGQPVPQAEDGSDHGYDYDYDYDAIELCTSSGSNLTVYFGPSISECLSSFSPLADSLAAVEQMFSDAVAAVSAADLLIYQQVDVSFSFSTGDVLRTSGPFTTWLYLDQENSTSVFIPEESTSRLCYVLLMMDTYGDGWNGNNFIARKYNVADGVGAGRAVHTVTLQDGREAQRQLCFEEGGATCVRLL
jgi:hypothetical protein